jgi:hypothetical protein
VGGGNMSYETLTYQVVGDVDHPPVSARRGDVRKALNKRIAKHRAAIKRHDSNARRYRDMAISCNRYAMEARAALSLDLFEREQLA